MSGRISSGVGWHGRWIICVLAFGLCASCGVPVLKARKKLTGFDIASGYSDGLALVRDSKSRRYGYIDSDGTLVIAARYADAQPFSEGLAAVRQNYWSAYGYIDRKGHMTIPATFEAAFPFSDGLAPVTVHGKQGYIDTSGTMRIPATFDCASPFSEGLARIVTNGFAGFVNTKGEMVIPPAYFKAGPFHGGLAPVCTRNKCGFVNAAGQTAIPFEYDDAAAFSGEFAPARVGRFWGYVDKRGKWLVEPAFDEAHPFRDDVALVGKEMTSQPDRGYGNYSGPSMVFGYLNRQGRFLIEPSIVRATSFSEGLAAIQVPALGFCSDCYDTRYLRKDGSLVSRVRAGGSFQGGRAVVIAIGPTGEAGFLIDREGRALMEFDRAWFDDPLHGASTASRPLFGYINQEGTPVLPHTFVKAEPFSDGLGLVQARGARGPSRSRYVDRRGAVKLEVPAEASSAQPFSGGLALLSFHRNGKTRYAYIDKTGTVRIEGDWSEARPFFEGLAAVKTSRESGRNDWGYLNPNGEFAISPRFNGAGPFIDGLAVVSYVKDKYLLGGVIDPTGKVVAETFYPELEPRNDWQRIRAAGHRAKPSELIPLLTREGFAYVDRDGRVAIRQAGYHTGQAFSEGLAAVMVKDGAPTGTWGYINSEGDLVVAAEFREARPFSEGLALVRDKTDRYGYINREGGWAIAPSFFEEAHDFREGRALVRLNGFYGYLNRKGEFAIRPKYVRASTFSEGLAATGVGQ